MRAPLSSLQPENGQPPAKLFRPLTFQERIYYAAVKLARSTGSTGSTGLDQLLGVLSRTTGVSEILPALMEAGAGLSVYRVYRTVLENIQPGRDWHPDWAADWAAEWADCEALVAGRTPASLLHIAELAARSYTLVDSPDPPFAALRACLVRDIPYADLYAAVARYHATASASQWLRVYPLLFFTRDAAGLGEREVFKRFCQALYALDPARLTLLLPLIPRYGCWRDLYQLQREAALAPGLAAAVLAVLVAALRAGVPGALAWAPRETKHRAQARALACALFPGEQLYSNLMKLYRMWGHAAGGHAAPPTPPAHYERLDYEPAHYERVPCEPAYYDSVLPDVMPDSARYNLVRDLLNKG